MLCIHLENTNPCYCLAAEELLLKNRAEDIFMVWQSRNSVIVGKHQNALAEINYRYVRENGISVSRRISGGGTVYHDPGNVNFSYIKNVSGQQEISFNQFTLPVIGALSELGVNAERSGHNDLIVNGKKFSGNAEHIYKNRVLHHGTLLFSSDLTSLGNAIRTIPGKYTGKAVQSNRSQVANISGFLSHHMIINDFIMHLVRFQLKQFPGSKMFEISASEEEQIRLLSTQKFETREWQFGYSPAYSFVNCVKIGNKILNLQLRVEKGKINSADISGNYYRPQDIQKLKSRIINMPHLYETIETAHQDVKIGFTEELIYSYF
jgi:lipoate---protein ligase